MQYQYTPAAQRALDAAAGWAGGEDSDELQAPALLLGLLAESECRAAIMLASHGIDRMAVRRRWGELAPRRIPSEGGEAIPGRFSDDLWWTFFAASERLREYPQPLELATEHLLLGLVAAEHEVSAWLQDQGLDPDTLEAEVHRLYGHRPGPLSSPPQPSILRPNRELQALSSVAWRIGTLRAVDAAANRAREGLRTVEDYVRFVLDDRHLTGLCKQLRHDLAAALGRISTEHRLAARETQADVGTVLATASEQVREDSAAVLTANFTRLQESLRSLEEFGKLLDVAMAAELEQLRYRSYTLQRAVDVTRTSLQRLCRARLYVLIDGRSSPEEFERLARPLIDAGVHALELRDKQLDDRRLLKRARLLRRWTDGSDTLLVINDRPDLAALARADGVHVGQDDVSVKDARTIVGPGRLIGVSTHSIEQARQAVLDGASYLGIGPTFPSGTKHFDEFPGVELLRAVASEIRLPAFAIGGITGENLPDVLATGIGRVAIAGGVATAMDPPGAAREILSALTK